MNDGRLVDYHVHLLGHLDVDNPQERLGDFIVTAIRRGVSEIGFADHDRYVDHADFPSFARAQKAFPEIAVRVGLEFDFAPERVKDMNRLLASYDLDYLIGSVHAIDGWDIDDPKQIDGWRARDVDDVYRQYYGLLAKAAATGLVSIIGHIDLPKVFGFRPKGDPASYAAPALVAIKRSGCAVEINTNGSYKPACEMYPERAILEKCFEMGIPVTLGSDAHAPENAGRDLAHAADLARSVGYTSLATFSRRRMVSKTI